MASCLSCAGVIASRCHARTRVDRGIDALAIGLMRQMRELQIGIALARRLEADDAGKQPSVDFRQHHMHGEIGRRQAAQRRRPILAARGRQRDLEHRTGSRIERRRAVIAHRRERGGVDDRRRRPLGEMRLAANRRRRAPSATSRTRRRRQTLSRNAADQRIDRPGIGRGEIGTIEGDERMRPAVGRRQRREHALRRIVKAHVGDFGLAEHRPGIKPGRQRQAARSRPAPPPRRRHRTARAAAAGSRPARSRAHRAAHRRGHRPAAPRARCRARFAS